MDIDRIIAALAERHHGAFARAETRAAGIDREAVARRIARGSIEAWSPRVLRVVAGFPEVLRIVAEELHLRPWIAVEAVRDLRSRYRTSAEAPRSGAENESSAS